MQTPAPDEPPVPESISASTEAAASPFPVGFRAARANLVPGLCVQAVMLVIVFAYYRLEQVRPWFDRLGGYKEHGGYVFTVASSMVAGAVLPAVFIFVCLEKRLPDWRDLGGFLFTGGFYGTNGLVVDLLYRWQNVWFGTMATAPILLKKILVDQLVYNPVFAAPFAVVCFAWKNQHYTFHVPEGSLTPRTYLRRVVPTLLATWTVWIPVVAVVYSLPPLLQIPIFSLALCFWALMLAYIHAKPKPVS